MIVGSAAISPRRQEESADLLFEGTQALAERSQEEFEMSLRVPFADEDPGTCLQVLTVKKSASAPRRELAGRQVRPLRVLLVDDNGLAAKFLAVLLRLDGHDAHIACDGVAALKCVRAYRPQVVLLDINLPYMSGFEVACRLRAREDTKNIFLAAVTGYGLKEDRNQFHEAGFDCHLVKPVDAVDLRRLLASVANGGKEVF